MDNGDRCHTTWDLVFSGRMETPRTPDTVHEDADGASTRRSNLSSFTMKPIGTSNPNNPAVSSSSSLSLSSPPSDINAQNDSKLFRPRIAPFDLSSPEYSHDDKSHLLVSLSQAHDSIVSLDTANKDLLGALNSKQTELDAQRMRNEQLEDEIGCIATEGEKYKWEYIHI